MNLRLALKTFGAVSTLQQLADEITSNLGDGVVGETDSYISWRPSQQGDVAIYFKKKSVSFALSASQAEDFHNANKWTQLESKAADLATKYVHINADFLEVASTRAKALDLATLAHSYKKL